MSEHLWSLAAPKGVNLDAISRGGMPEWTAAELAMACAGLPPMPFAAAMFSIAGDSSMYRRLKYGTGGHLGLLDHLLAERDRNQWAHKVERMNGERTKFAEELIDVFLADELRPCVFQASPEMKARHMNVEPETWRRVLSHQYACVQAEFHRWLLEAVDHVSRRTRAA